MKGNGHLTAPLGLVRRNPALFLCHRGDCGQRRLHPVRASPGTSISASSGRVRPSSPVAPMSRLRERGDRLAVVVGATRIGACGILYGRPWRTPGRTHSAPVVTAFSRLQVRRCNLARWSANDRPGLGR